MKESDSISSSKEILNYIIDRLNVYDQREKQSIAFMIIEDIYGLSKADILADKIISSFNEEQVVGIIERLNSHEPIQYIFGKADFYGRVFLVKPGVLIPRPETEELVDLVIKENKAKKNLKILDVGTGSGCIAISLALDLPDSRVTAFDISEIALEITNENTKALNASVQVIKHNIAEDSFDEKFDVIVSNPPYITPEEETLMQGNVLDFEPHLALFAPQDDPLFFYRKILEFAQKNLLPGGKIYFEINEQFGLETADLVTSFGFEDVRVIQDLFGKDRIVTGLPN